LDFADWEEADEATWFEVEEEGAEPHHNWGGGVKGWE
jgi:hypothetical protein